MLLSLYFIKKISYHTFFFFSLFLLLLNIWLYQSSLIYTKALKISFVITPSHYYWNSIWFSKKVLFVSYFSFLLLIFHSNRKYKSRTYQSLKNEGYEGRDYQPCTSLPLCLVVVGIRTREIAVQVRD